MTEAPFVTRQVPFRLHAPNVEKATGKPLVVKTHIGVIDPALPVSKDNPVVLLNRHHFRKRSKLHRRKDRLNEHQEFSGGRLYDVWMHPTKGERRMRARD